MGKIKLQKAIDRLAIGIDKYKSFIETKGAFRDIDGTIHNKLYFVLDMDGVDGFTNNEKGFVYVDSTGTIEYAKTWNGIKQYVNSQILLIDAYTKTEADGKFEPKSYDFSNTETPLTFNETNAKRFQIITKPAGADQTPIGATNKLVIKVSTTDPTQLPQDGDQITYGTDLVWIVKANGDIMSWGEIKDNVSAKKIMVIKHLSNGNWELVRWDDKPTEKAEKDLSNVNIGTANAGKIFQVKADGTIEYIDKPIPTWKDITAGFKSRAFTHDDIGKSVRISFKDRYNHTRVLGGVITNGYGSESALQVMSQQVKTNNANTPSVVSGYKVYFWHPTRNGKVIEFADNEATFSAPENHLIDKFEIKEI